MRTLCDVCESAAALFFCSADQAALCHSCDHKVHTCNKLASLHVRVRLADPKAVTCCDICEKEPAFFYCEIDGTSLCLQCDMAVHVGGKRKHGRYLIFRQQVEFGDPASTSMNYVPTGREVNANKQSHRNPSSDFASASPANEQISKKVIDLNIKPQWPLESASNSQQ